MNEKSKHNTPAVRVVPNELSTFIDRLAEDVVLSNDIPACAMCAIGSCDHQARGQVCQNAVRAWLLVRAGEYLAAGKEKKPDRK